MKIMSKPKSDSGNHEAGKPPVSKSKKEGWSGGAVSGSAQSTGGSRQGNAGHQVNPETSQGNR